MIKEIYLSTIAAFHWLRNYFEKSKIEVSERLLNIQKYYYEAISKYPSTLTKKLLLDYL